MSHEQQRHRRVTHRNTETGTSLQEEDHYAGHVDLAAGKERATGQTWHVRNEGRLVLSGAGRLSIDLRTGDIVVETPNTSTSTSVCTLFGDAA